MELAMTNPNLTFGQLILGDGNKAKADFRRSLSRSARVCKSSTATAVAAETRAHPPKVVQTKVRGYETKALSHSGAALSSTSEKLCDKLTSGVNRHSLA